MPLGVNDDPGGFPENCRTGFLQHAQALTAPSVGQSLTRCQVELGDTRAQGVKNLGQVATGHFLSTNSATQCSHPPHPKPCRQTTVKIGYEDRVHERELCHDTLARQTSPTTGGLLPDIPLVLVLVTCPEIDLLSCTLSWHPVVLSHHPPTFLRSRLL